MEQQLSLLHSTNNNNNLNDSNEDIEQNNNHHNNSGQQLAPTNSVPQLKLNIPWCGCDDNNEIKSPGAVSPMSPRRRQAKNRENSIKRVVRVVISPFPYMVLILLAAMIVMIFVNVMPISGLICVSSMVMVIAVVVGNHWQNQKVWEELPEDETSSSSTKTATLGGGATVNINHNAHKRRKSSSSSSLTNYSKLMRTTGDDTENINKTDNKKTMKDDCADQNNTNGNSIIERDDSKLVIDTHEGSFHPPLTHEEKTDNLNEFFEGLFHSIDYSLLLIFMGTFIVVENMASTGIPKFVW